MTYKEEIHLMAKEYIAKGWHVIKLHGVNDDGSCTCGKSTCTDIGKHPATARGVKDATRDPAKVDELLGPQSSPDNPNLGIVTGEISNLTVIDIDSGPGKVGAESWATVIAEHGEPDTLRCLTGGGGTHLFFAYNSALKTASNVLGKHIDCRNDGGYVVAAPSRHRSGNRYVWDNWGTPLAPLPAHLTKKKETRGRPRKDDLYRKTYTLEQVEAMLEFVPADDRDLWRYVGIILGREFKRSDAAWELYNRWSNKWDGMKGRGHDAIMEQAFQVLSQESSEKDLTLGTIIKAAIEGGWIPTKGSVSDQQFVYDHESNGYIYRPSGAVWIAASVDAACGDINDGGKLIKASVYIQQHAHVTTTTCTPAIQGDVLKGYDCRDGVLFESPGGAVYNRYRPPTIELGDASLAGPFEQHVRLLMQRKGDADQFLNYMAHLVQRPEEKLRFALMLAGGQGIGKDSSLDFCSPAIGPWNVANIAPSAFEGAFNEYATKTLVRINEAANSAEMSRWAFNERTKVLIAGNPDVCEINPKYGRKFTVTMHCAVILTTNHLTGSVHIPADDRRYDVIQCATLEEMGLSDDKKRRDYFTGLWEWFLKKDGSKHIAAFLHKRDLSGFSAALGQRKTAAHTEIVHHGMIGDEWARDIVDGLGNPDVLNGKWIMERAVGRGEREADVRARMSHALDRMGYEVLRNPKYQDGRWKLNGVLCKVYKRRDYRPEPEPKWQEALEILNAEK